MKKAQRISPLQDKPLRSPGQWLDEEINRLWDDQVIGAALWILILITAIVYSWLFYLSPPESAPILPTAIALLVIGFQMRRIVRAKRSIEKMKLGRDGEKIVGQSLEALRIQGFTVLHDIQMNVGEMKFNVDHVLFSENGIYAIETKTLSKKVKASKILYDGNRITIDGRHLKSDPITQVKASANRLRELLKESTGIDFPVKGIVVFPGWYIESKVPPSKSEVWVLNPKAMPKFVSTSKRVLETDQVKMAFFHLSRYVRSAD